MNRKIYEIKSLLFILFLSALLSNIWGSTPNPRYPGRNLLSYSGQESQTQDTSLYEFNFRLSEDGNLLLVNLTGELKEGKIIIWFGGGGYDVIGNYEHEGHLEMKNEMFGPLNNRETIKVKITTKNAVGNWKIDFSELTRSKKITMLLISGLLTVIVTIIFIIGWKKISGSLFKWLFVGAGLWLVGVALKFGFAYSMNNPVLEFLKSTTGPAGYLLIGSIYIGILTGIFEIGITLAFALYIKVMYESSKNGISVGVGAGTFEALLIGFAPIGYAIMAITNQATGNQVLIQISQLSMVTPLLWLTGSVERIIAILCHISSRTLVLFSIAKKRYIYFWAGFFILTAIDSIAGYFHLAGLVGKISIWWIELAILPFAIISIPIIRWCIKNWE